MLTKRPRMRMTLIKAIVFATVLMPLVARAESPDDILIVANRSVSLDSITAFQAKDIFLRKKTAWNDGQKAVPVHAQKGNKLRDDFRDRVLGMSHDQMQMYWVKHRIVSGQTEPVSFPNPLKAVFKLKGALGYIYRSQYKEGVVKILLVIDAGK